MEFCRLGGMAELMLLGCGGIAVDGWMDLSLCSSLLYEDFVASFPLVQGLLCARGWCGVEGARVLQVLGIEMDRIGDGLHSCFFGSYFSSSFQF